MSQKTIDLRIQKQNIVISSIFPQPLFRKGFFLLSFSLSDFTLAFLTFCKVFMKKWLCLFAVGGFYLIGEETALVYPHNEVKQYSMHGNFQKGLATKAMGSKQFEIWQASIAVGSKTPKHVHDTEEVFIVLKGELLVVIGDEEVHCKAPATLICPANIPHQLINIGDEPTEHILVLGIDSKIFDSSGNIMHLPWR